MECKMVTLNMIVNIISIITFIILIYRRFERQYIENLLFKNSKARLKLEYMSIPRSKIINTYRERILDKMYRKGNLK